jgi:hypothetical protein
MNEENQLNAVALTITQAVSIPIRGSNLRVSVEMTPEKRKQRDSALIYAENRLAPWAKWAKEHRAAIGYPTISLLYKAMQMTKIGIIRGTVTPLADEHGNVHYPINADGHESRSMKPVAVGEVPEVIAEVDQVVAKLPKDLHTVIIADYFTYGPIEVRCKETPWKRARYSQLLECAKYSVFVALSSRTKSDV